MVRRKDLLAQLVLHEGLRLKPYLDTEGYWTVLVGYNLSSRGYDFIDQVLGQKIRPTPSSVTATRPFGDLAYTSCQAGKILNADLDRLEQVVPIHFPEYRNLSEIRQRVVLDMAFNMGFKALGFKNAIAAAKVKDWSRCAREMYKSRWARQVGDGEGGRFDRADRLARMVLTDNAPTDVPPLANGLNA